MFAVTFLAVAKVLVATFVGALMKSSVPSSTSTLRDFNFINTNILLPCLTVSNTAKSVDLQVLLRCSALLFFGLLFILIGIGCAMLTSPVLFKIPRTATGIPVEMAKDARLELMYDPLTPQEEAEEGGTTSATTQSGKKKKKKRSKRKGKPYVALILSDSLKTRGVTGHDVVPLLEVPGVETETYPGYAWGNWIGCSIQNTIALPLPILQTLSQSIPWVDYTAGSAYIFVFSIMCTIWTWSGGPIIVEVSQKESVKKHLIREIVHRHLQMPMRADATTQTGRHLPARTSLTGASPVSAEAPVSGAARAHTGAATALTSSEAMASRAPPPEPRVTRPTTVESDPSFFAPPLPATDSAPEHTDRSLQTLPASPVRGSPPRRGVGQVASGPSHSDLHAHATPTSRAPLASAGAVPDAVHGAVAAVGSARTRDGLALEVEEVAVQIPYDWEAEGLIRVFYASDLKAAQQQGGPTAAQRLSRALRSLGSRLIRNVNFVSIFVGMFIGITPFFRYLFFGGPLEILMDAAALLGGGNVPASLLLLGASLVGTAEVEAKGGQTQTMVRDSEQNTEFPVYERALDLLDTEGAYERWFNRDDDDDDDAQLYAAAYDLHGHVPSPPPAQAAASSEDEHHENDHDGGEDPHAERPAGTADADGPVADGPSLADRARFIQEQEEAEAAAKEASGGCVSGLRRFLSMEGINQHFLWGIIFNRLFLCTLVGFIVTVFCLRAFPFLFGGRGTEDRTMVVVLFLQVAAPAAINTSILYNNREYMVFPWARMLLFMYLLSTITVVGWVTISLSIVEAL